MHFEFKFFYFYIIKLLKNGSFWKSLSESIHAYPRLIVLGIGRGVERSDAGGRLVA